MATQPSFAVGAGSVKYRHPPHTRPKALALATNISNSAKVLVPRRILLNKEATFSVIESSESDMTQTECEKEMCHEKSQVFPESGRRL